MPIVFALLYTPAISLQLSAVSLQAKKLRFYAKQFLCGSAES